MRLFENHPDLSITSYTFHDAFYWGPEPLLRRDIAQRIAQRGGITPGATYQSRFDRLQKIIADAEAAGKIPFIKEHLYYITDPQTIAANVICLPNGTPRIISTKPTIEGVASAPVKSLSLPANPTVLPNDFLATFLPVILIRHPAKIIPSYYRVSRDAHGTTVFDEDFPMNASLRWLRLIFDWYEECYRISKIERPIVIDAEDMINDSHYVTEKFCAMTGLDPKHVQYSWAEATEACGPVRAKFMSTLRNSTGIIREDQKPIVIEDEAQKWTEEFGEEVSHAIVSYVNATMPDYEYLMKSRLSQMI